MTGQQFYVVADRRRGDPADETWVCDGDRVTYGSVNSTGELVIDRIERPVPTTDEPQKADATPDEAFELGEAHGYDKGYADGLAAAPQPPTRAQIAKVIEEAIEVDIDTAADAVLDLLQKGGER